MMLHWLEHAQKQMCYPCNLQLHTSIQNADFTFSSFGVTSYEKYDEILLFEEASLIHGCILSFGLHGMMQGALNSFAIDLSLCI